MGGAGRGRRGQRGERNKLKDQSRRLLNFVDSWNTNELIYFPHRCLLYCLSSQSSSDYDPSRSDVRSTSLRYVVVASLPRTLRRPTTQTSLSPSFVAINYRLAPETRFPGPLHDAVSAYFRLIDDLKIPPENILFAGDSAGGGLSLALLMYLRDNGEFETFLYLRICGVVLSFPSSTDASNIRLPSSLWSDLDEPLGRSDDEL